MDLLTRTTMKINFKDSLAKCGYILIPLTWFDEEHWFIVDTGAPRNIIDDDYFCKMLDAHPEIGLYEAKVLDQNVWGASQEGESKVPKNCVLEIPFDEVKLDFGVIAYGNAFKQISKDLNKKIVGLIGATGLLRFKARINYSTYDIEIDY